MKAAFIVMSILGCDDNGAQCQPVASVAEQWPTIAACDAASERHLGKYRNVSYPMMVAVCQTADTTALADSQEDVAEIDPKLAGIPTTPPAANKDDPHSGITQRAIALVEYALPSKATLKSTITRPVHIVTDTYSWVARKIVP